MASLLRPLRGRVLAGVCLALANRLGLSVTLVRVLWIVLSFIPGPLWVVYVVLWALIPSEGSPPRR